MEVALVIARTARRMGIDLDVGELLTIRAGLTRIDVDDENEGQVLHWVRRELGLAPDLGALLDVLRQEKRKDTKQRRSVRTLAREYGLSKSRIAQLLSEVAA